MDDREPSASSSSSSSVIIPPKVRQARKKSQKHTFTEDNEAEEEGVENWTKKHVEVGSRVAGVFEGQIYGGYIDKVLPRHEDADGDIIENIYHVIYDDGDDNELEGESELQFAKDLLKSLPAESLASSSSSSSSSRRRKRTQTDEDDDDEPVVVVAKKARKARKPHKRAADDADDDGNGSTDEPKKKKKRSVKTSKQSSSSSSSSSSSATKSRRGKQTKVDEEEDDDCAADDDEVVIIPKTKTPEELAHEYNSLRSKKSSSSSNQNEFFSLSLGDQLESFQQELVLRATEMVDERISVFTEMGFSSEQATEALQNCNNDVNEALSMLLAGGK